MAPSPAVPAGAWPVVAPGGLGTWAGMIGVFVAASGGFVVGMIGVPPVAGVAGGVTPGPVTPGWTSGASPLAGAPGTCAVIGSPEPAGGAAAVRSASLDRAA